MRTALTSSFAANTENAHLNLIPTVSDRLTATLLFLLIKNSLNSTRHIVASCITAGNTGLLKNPRWGSATTRIYRARWTLLTDLESVWGLSIATCSRVFRESAPAVQVLPRRLIAFTNSTWAYWRVWARGLSRCARNDQEGSLFGDLIIYWLFIYPHKKSSFLLFWDIITCIICFSLLKERLYGKTAWIDHWRQISNLILIKLL
jgi:hypothetical protein